MAKGKLRWSAEELGFFSWLSHSLTNRLSPTLSIYSHDGWATFCPADTKRHRCRGSRCQSALCRRAFGWLQGEKWGNGKFREGKTPRRWGKQGENCHKSCVKWTPWSKLGHLMKELATETDSVKNQFPKLHKDQGNWLTDWQEGRMTDFLGTQ